jgi:amino acid transporter
MRLLTPAQTAAIFWTFAGVLAIIVTILAMAKNGRHSAEYVFTSFEPSSGWPAGWSFMVGLLHAGYATSSTGMIISMCEEVRDPARQVPKAMVATIFINTFAGLLFLIPLVFVLPDIQELVLSPQPVPIIILSAVGNSGAAFALCLPLLVLAVLCGVGCTTAASRCTWAFSRDGAIPGSRWWKQINHKLDVPFNAMMLSMVVQLVLGLLRFGSAAAFNAFSGVGVISLTAAYAVPIAINLFTGRKATEGAKFSLGKFGVVLNVVALGTSFLLFSVHRSANTPQPGPPSPCPCSACPPPSPSPPTSSTTPPSSSSPPPSSRPSGTSHGATRTTPVPRRTRPTTESP